MSHILSYRVRSVVTVNAVTILTFSHVVLSFIFWCMVMASCDILNMFIFHCKLAVCQIT